MRGSTSALPMTPTDLILVLMSFGTACLAIVAQGWTFHGVGPASLALAGGFWQLWTQWLRHRSWLRHRDSGFVPGTQHLALSEAVGWCMATVGAMICVWVALKGLR